MGGLVKRKWNRLKNHRGASLAVGLAVAAGAIGLTTPAVGHHGYDNMFPTVNYQGGSSACFKGSHVGGNVCRADNGTHAVHFRSTVPSNMVSGTSASLNGSYDVGTDMSIIYHSSSQVSYSGSAETDIIYGGTSQNLNDNTYGVAYCDDPIESWWGGSTSRCDQFYVIYNRNVTPGFSSRQARAAGCHETGHTVGLVHGSNAFPSLSNGDSSLACMRTNVPYSTMNPYLKEHNTYEINRTY